MAVHGAGVIHKNVEASSEATAEGRVNLGEQLGWAVEGAQISSHCFGGSSGFLNFGDNRRGPGQG
jgi:hypothetical protein